MPAGSSSLGRTVLLTALALSAFAGNSLLCRLALVGDGALHPLAFSGIRLASGALVLLPCLRRPSGGAGGSAPSSGVEGGWRFFGAGALFVYATAFSLAYVTLGAGVGALLLFGSVQVTMLGYGFVRGERLRPAQGVGLALAVSGLLVQVAPGLTAPDPAGAVLMGLAGVSWGAYSLHGRGLASPRRATARSFAGAAPLALLAMLLASGDLRFDLRGFLLAATSGAVTSGLGYVLWFAALRGHTATSAALVQLIVPVLAALSAIPLLGESMDGRLLGATALTLGGIGLAILGGRRVPTRR